MSPRSSGPGDGTAAVRLFDEHAVGFDRGMAAGAAYHEHLRISVRRMGLRGQDAPLRLLDVGCGTGASTAALLDVAPEAEIVAVDASTRMLDQARRKSWPPGVRFAHTTIEELDAVDVTGPFDGILAANVVRLLPDPNAALRGLRTLLAPGAPLAVHEFSVRDSGRSRMRWTIRSWAVAVPGARFRGGCADLARLQWRSVLDFDGVEAFTTRMRATGYADVRVQTMPGWQQHIAHTFLGRRPGAPEPASPQAGGGRPAPTPRAPGSPPVALGNDEPTPPAGIDMTKAGPGS